MHEACGRVKGCDRVWQDMDSDLDEEDIKDITYKVFSVSDDAREVEVFDSWYDFSLIMQIQDFLMNFQIALFQ